MGVSTASQYYPNQPAEETSCNLSAEKIPVWEQTNSPTSRLLQLKHNSLLITPIIKLRNECFNYSFVTQVQFPTTSTTFIYFGFTYLALGFGDNNTLNPFYRASSNNPWYYNPQWISMVSIEHLQACNDRPWWRAFSQVQTRTTIDKDLIRTDYIKSY